MNTTKSVDLADGTIVLRPRCAQDRKINDLGVITDLVGTGPRAQPECVATAGPVCPPR
jgi:hypothetical protein